MSHYRLSDSMPSAIILARNPRTSSLDELKTYTGNHIFLNNKDEFQIRLFNPLREKIGVQIGFNGQLSSSMLVLNPGEDVIVDRFLDDQRKMLFETYQYDKGNSAAVNAVANNGIVEIRFFKEYIYTPPITTWTNGTLTINGTFQLSDSCCTYTSGTAINIGQNAGCGTLNNLNGTSNNNYVYDNTIFNCCSMDSSLDFASDFTLQEEQPQYKSKQFASKIVDNKQIKAETGRVEKGQHSDQNFKQVDIQFQNYPFHSVIFNLKPVSEKNSYVHHEIREYCTKCSYRVRNKKWDYCPRCGYKL